MKTNPQTHRMGLPMLNEALPITLTTGLYANNLFGSEALEEYTKPNGCNLTRNGLSLRIKRAAAFLFLLIVGFAAFPQITVTISSSEPNPTNANPIPIEIIFSEGVAGFEMGEISVTNGIAQNFNTIGNPLFTVEIVPNAQGLVSISVPADVCLDQTSGSISNSASNAFEITFDSEPPVLTSVTIASSNAINSEYAKTGHQIFISITASEILQSVTGMVGGNSGESSGADDVWTISYTTTGTEGEGIMSFNIDFTDLAGNTGAPVVTTTDESTVTFDITPPSVTLSNNYTNPTTEKDISFYVSFDEEVYEFMQDGVTFTGEGSITNFEPVEGNVEYLVYYQFGEYGVYTFEVLFGVCTDLAGNENQEALAPLEIEYISDAVAPAGTGTPGDPYQIATLGNLKWVSQNIVSWNDHFVQVANIDATETMGWNEGDGWLPIGNNLAPFNGSYNGDGHIISNLFINRLTDSIGFFGWADFATITSLGLIDIQVSGGHHVGGLVGSANNTVIDTCFTTGTVNGIGYYAGGLAGFLNGSQISSSFSTASVSSNEFVGGLVGEISNTSTLNNCYSTGDITGIKAGGLVGHNNTNSIINYCFSTGSVPENAMNGGLVGIQFSSSVSYSFWDTETSGQATSVSGIGFSTAEMKTLSTYIGSGWDFIGETANGSGNYWGINSTDNSGYPFLAWQGYEHRLPAAVTTQDATIITGSTATLNGNLTDLGYPNPTAFGFCWNTTGSPTVETDEFINLGGALAVGTYTHQLTDLSPVTTYHVKAYATNTDGTVYGNEITFETLQGVLTIGGSFTVFHRSYDGSNLADIDQNNLFLVGVIGGDIVSLGTVDAIFAQISEGADITVTISNASLDGNDSWKYTLSLAGAPSAVADITPKELTISGYFTVLSKTFDGTTEATIDENGLSLEGVVGEEDVSLVDVVAQFDQSEPGTSITVSIVGANLSGSDMNNYTLTLAGAPTAMADINPITFHLTLLANPDNIGAVLMGEGDYIEGGNVNISVNSIGGFNFTGWTGESIDTVLLDDPSAMSTFFLMPAREVTFTANFEEFFDVTFYVTNSSADPVQGASIHVDGAPATYITNESGMDVGYLPAGNYTYYVEHMDYRTTYGSFEVTGSGTEVYTTMLDPIDFGTVSDIDGNVYNTVIIGEQEWMAENLRVTRYRNDVSIPTELDNSSWSTTTEGAYAVYPYAEIDGLNSEVEVLDAYGALYNWYTVNNPNGLCPDGWRVPNNSDWNELIQFIGGVEYAGKDLKSCRQVSSPLGGECATDQHPRWNSSPYFGTDTYDFSIVPAGQRFADGIFWGIGNRGTIQSADQQDEFNSHAVYTFSVQDYMPNQSDYKNLGYSVRCIKNEVLPGPVAYYPFNGNTDDMSGNENHGTNNGATPTTDRFGNENSAYSFDGSSNIDLQNTSSLNMYTGFSLVAWVVTNNPNEVSIISKHENGWQNGCNLTSSYNKAGVNIHVPVYSITTTEVYDDNNWHLFIGTFDGSTLSLYVDGILKNSIAASYSIGNAINIKIGSDSQLSFFNGKIDDVRIYNRTLTETEIVDLYHEGGWDLPEPSLVAHYPFDGNADDMSLYGNHGTVNGATDTEDRFGNIESALLFNGFSDYVDISTHSITTTGDFTTNAWVNAAEADFDYIINATNAQTMLGGGLENIHAICHYFDGLQWDVYSSTSSFPSNSWAMVSIVRSGEEIVFYINGVQSGVFYEPSINEVTFLNVGGDGSDPDRYLNGKLDDIRIYNRALTQQEILELLDGYYTAPTIYTNNPTNITANSVTSGGYIDSNGGFEVTASGVIYSSANTLFEHISLEYIQNFALSSDIINGSSNENNQLFPGSIILYKTKEGRYGKFMVKSHVGDITIKWLTFDEFGNPYSSGDDLTIHSSWLCNLDIGAEVDTDNDFYWANLDGTIRYLVPQNGALFGIYTGQGTVLSLDNAEATTYDGTSDGTFVSLIEGLVASTSYYAKAYATNAIGTGYGDETFFTTASDEVQYINIIRGGPPETMPLAVPVQIAGNNAAPYQTNLSQWYDGWGAPQAIFDQGEHVDNPYFWTNISANSGAGTTWYNEIPGTSYGILVVDLQQPRNISLVSAFQMFSDGKTTHIALAGHGEMGGTAPDAFDEGWAEFLPKSAVNEGTDYGYYIGNPSLFNINTNTRYVKIMAYNDGSYGWESYIEFKGIKMFEGEAPQYNVTFTIDMTNASNFAPESDILYITGNMIGWSVPGDDPSNQTMERVDESMIWTKTLQLMPGSYEYKYFLNYGWANGEWGGEPNRTFELYNDIEVHDIWGYVEGYAILTLQLDPAGAGTINGDGLYPQGSEVNVSVMQNLGYQFINWTDEEMNVISDVSSFIFTLPDSNVTLIAHFDVLPTYDLTFNVSDINENSVKNASITLRYLGGSEGTKDKSTAASLSVDQREKLISMLEPLENMIKEATMPTKEAQNSPSEDPDFDLMQAGVPWVTVEKNISKPKATNEKSCIFFHEFFIGQYFYYSEDEFQYVNSIEPLSGIPTDYGFIMPDNSDPWSLYGILIRDAWVVGSNTMAWLNTKDSRIYIPYQNIYPDWDPEYGSLWIEGDYYASLFNSCSKEMEFTAWVSLPDYGYGWGWKHFYFAPQGLFELETDDAGLVTVNTIAGNYFYEVNRIGYETLANSVQLSSNQQLDITLISLFEGGIGTYEEPFLIKTAEQLNAIRNFLGGGNYGVCFKQIEDIDLGVTPWNQGNGWEPIGNQPNQFFGNYNGDGHTISNLTIFRPGFTGVGLFGFANQATISNLNLEDVSIIGGQRIGALVGRVDFSNIINCSSSGTATGGNFTAGLVGNLYNSSTISNCSSSVDVMAVEGEYQQYGGLVGRLIWGSSIENSYATGNVSGFYWVGGLAGLSTDGCSIANSYATGNVSAYSYSGGLVAEIIATNISNTYSTGRVAGYNAGGLVGRTQGEDVVVTNSYWNVETSGQVNSPVGEPKTTLQMISQATFNEWDFSETWSIVEGVTYPYLQTQLSPEGHNYPPAILPPSYLQAIPGDEIIELSWQGPSLGSESLSSYHLYRDGNHIATLANNQLTYTDEGLTNFTYYTYHVKAVYDSEESSPSNEVSTFPNPGFAGGDGTEETPYLVSNANELYTVRLYRWAFFRQTNDIDLSGSQWYEGEGWIPINFNGHYDGDGYTISGLRIDRPSTNYQGLFGITNGAVIKNLAIANALITGQNYVGGFVGNTNSSTIDNCSFNGNIIGGNYVGGLVGFTSLTNLFNSFTSGNINSSGNWAGGLTGINNNNSSISMCYSTTNVYAPGFSVGGLSGTCELNSTITNSYSTGLVYGDHFVGGLVGWVEGESIILNCYSTGYVGGNYDIGGFVGYVNNGYVYNSYYNVETSGTGYSFYGDGLSTEQMLSSSNFYEWDFSSTWNIIEGETFPYLLWQGGPGTHNYPPQPFLVTLNVDMTNAQNFNPASDIVYITGDMFGWALPGDDPSNQTMMRVGETMTWTKTVELPAGIYHYKYFLNYGWDYGEWGGEPNRLLVVTDNIEVNDIWAQYQGGGEIYFKTFHPAQLGVTYAELSALIYGDYLEVWERGFYIGTTPNPVEEGIQINAGSGPDWFYSWQYNLLGHTIYYLVAYAHTNRGTLFTDVVSFKTYLRTIEDVDGNTYFTTLIDNQEWMVNNLKTTRYVNNEPIQYIDNWEGWSANTTGAYTWFNYDAGNYYSNKGALYNWYAVDNANGLCPAGWHVPSNAEWEALRDYLGGPTVAGGKMKMPEWEWESPNTGATNESNFSAYPAGYYYEGMFESEYQSANWLASDLHPTYEAPYNYSVNYNNAGLKMEVIPKEVGVSIRCVKEAVPTIERLLSPADGEVLHGVKAVLGMRVMFTEQNYVVVATDPGFTNIVYQVTEPGHIILFKTGILQENTTHYWKVKVTGLGQEVWSETRTFTTGSENAFVDNRDGKVYEQVQVGTQIWMAENLNFNAGPFTNYYNYGQPDAFGAYYNWTTAMGFDEYYLYNLYTNPISDQHQGVCPVGWHIPTIVEIQNMDNFLGPNGGGKLKTTGTIDEETGLWNTPNAGATNEVGFSLLPAGVKEQYSSWEYEYGILTTSTQYANNGFQIGYAHYGSPNLEYNSWQYKTDYAPIRCVKNSNKAMFNVSSIYGFPLDSVVIRVQETTFSMHQTQIPLANGQWNYMVTRKGYLNQSGTLNMSSADINIDIMMSPAQPVTLTVEKVGAGKISPAAGTYNKYFEDETITLFAISLQGVPFSHWVINGVTYTDSTATITLSQNTLATAYFGLEPLPAIEGTFLAWWQALKTYNLGMLAEVMADHTTCSWGNFGWRENSIEPPLGDRPPYNNSSTNTMSDHLITWQNLYSVIDIANAVIDVAGDAGYTGEDKQKLLATAHLIKGLSLGQLGLTYDKGLEIVDGMPLLIPWQDVIGQAIQNLNLAISNVDTPFQLSDGTVNGINITSDYIIQLANTYSARFLALSPRNAEQIASVNWAEVLAFAQEGLSTDFAPLGQGLAWDGGTWWDLNVKYLRQPGWGRVDCRLINLLDTEYPNRYPVDIDGLATVGVPNPHNTEPAGQAISMDERLYTDFMFLQSNDFRPERGGFHFSHYRFSRFDMPQTTNPQEGEFMGESQGPLYEFRAYEVKLLEAEAYARLDDLELAINILNDPGLPRKARGNLPDIEYGIANQEDVLNAIFYEREIELFMQGYMIHFADMRRRNMLQYGTPLHFPIPFQVLKNYSFPVYTHGGVENADGINTSNGGNWINYGTLPPIKVVTFNVFSAVNNTSLTGFTITINGTVYPVSQRIFNLSTGNYNYTITREGFISYSGTFNVVNGNKVINIYLSPVPLYYLAFHLVDNMQPIVSASVTVNAMYRLTNQYGYASFTSLPSGSYNYMINYGQNSVIEGVAEVYGNTLITIDISQSVLSFNVNLIAGWNIFSSYLIPEDMDMKSIVQPLIDEGLLVKVQDQNGLAVEFVTGNWINNIGDLNLGQGYKIRVNQNCALPISGIYADGNATWHYLPGWNIGGFPFNYSVNALSQSSYLIDLGVLQKIQSQTGAAVEFLPGFGWINSIGNFIPGQGYRVRVNSEIQIGDKEGESTQKDPNLYTESIFVPAWEGRGFDHQNIYIVNATLNDKPLPLGTQIGVFDGDLCVGIAVVTDAEASIISMVATKDDPYTQTIDGFTPGNEINIRLWDSNAMAFAHELDITMIEGSMNFVSSGTLVIEMSAISTPTDAGTITDASYVGSIFPNPFSNSTTVSFYVSGKEHVNISIYNVLGQKVTTLIDKTMDKGYHRVEWDTTNESIPEGIYLVRMETNGSHQTKRVIFTR